MRVSLQASDDGQAILSVSDTGIGIPAEQTDGIFEEFSQLDNPLQSRSKGTGLGLPTSRRMVDLLAAISAWKAPSARARASSSPSRASIRM